MPVILRASALAKVQSTTAPCHAVRHFGIMEKNAVYTNVMP